MVGCGGGPCAGPQQHSRSRAAQVCKRRMRSPQRAHGPFTWCCPLSPGFCGRSVHHRRRRTIQRPVCLTDEPRTEPSRTRKASSLQRCVPTATSTQEHQTDQLANAIACLINQRQCHRELIRPMLLFLIAGCTEAFPSEMTRLCTQLMASEGPVHLTRCRNCKQPSCLEDAKRALLASGRRRLWYDLRSAE